MRSIIFLILCLVSCGVWMPAGAWSQTVVKVVLMAGQSNMQGYANKNGLPPVLQNPQTDVLFYDGSADSKVKNTLMALQPNSTSGGGYFGPEITFGRAMADASSGTLYALIKYGDAGKNLHTDFRAPHPGQPLGGLKYRSMMDTFQNGLAALSNAGYAPDISGMLWLQGESDAGTFEHADAYDENLTAFILDMRSHFGAGLPFVIGGIGYTSSAYRNHVIAGQISVATAMSEVAYFDNDDINSTVPYNQLLHFEAPQMQTIGERYAMELQAIPEPSAPALLGLGLLTLCGLGRRRCRSFFLESNNNPPKPINS